MGWVRRVRRRLAAFAMACVAHRGAVVLDAQAAAEEESNQTPFSISSCRQVETLGQLTLIPCFQSGGATTYAVACPSGSNTQSCDFVQPYTLIEGPSTFQYAMTIPGAE